jgi:hypothetical protein
MGSGFLDLRTGGYRTSEAYGALTRGSPDGFPAAPPSPVSLVRWQARPEGWSTSPLHRIYGQSNGRDRLHCDLSPLRGLNLLALATASPTLRSPLHGAVLSC